MRILVTAPATKIGQRILRELLAPEFSVRVLVGDPACLPREIQRQVRVLRGSTGDAASLSRALDGVEALLWHVPREWFQETDPRGHYERLARTCAFAIRQAATPRVVSISEDSAGPAMENILNESGAAIRHLRYAGNDVTAIIDAALRWLVRRDWKGIERVTVPTAQPAGTKTKHSIVADRKYEYDTEEISAA